MAQKKHGKWSQNILTKNITLEKISVDSRDCIRAPAKHTQNTMSIDTDLRECVKRVSEHNTELARLHTHAQLFEHNISLQPTPSACHTYSTEGAHATLYLTLSQASCCSMQIFSAKIITFPAPYFHLCHLLHL